MPRPGKRIPCPRRCPREANVSSYYMRPFCFCRAAFGPHPARGQRPPDRRKIRPMGRGAAGLGGGRGRPLRRQPPSLAEPHGGNSGKAAPGGLSAFADRARRSHPEPGGRRPCAPGHDRLSRRASDQRPRPGGNFHQCAPAAGPAPAGKGPAPFNERLRLDL